MRQSSKSLDQLLEDISVSTVEDETNEANNGGLTAVLGWWCVMDRVGIIAYHATEAAAFKHRLAIINDISNGNYPAIA